MPKKNRDDSNMQRKNNHLTKFLQILDNTVDHVEVEVVGGFWMECLKLGLAPGLATSIGHSSDYN